MKTFTTYLLLITITIFALSSCEDNFEFSEDETTTTGPTELDVVLLEGQVLDINNVAIPGVEVNISHSDLITTKNTNDEGWYSIQLPLDDSRVLLQVQADSYLTSGIDAVTLDNPNKLNDVKLLKQDESDYSGEVELLSLITDGVLSGQILYEDGTPAPDVTITY